MKNPSSSKFFILPIISVLLTISHASLAQENELLEKEQVSERSYKLRPIRLGIKLGFPNLIGGSVEYVTPLLRDKLAANLDYSTVKSDWFMSKGKETDDSETSDLNFSYIEAGLNYYFFKAGKGLYGGATYSRFGIEATTFEQDDNGQDGTGKIDYNQSSFNVKLGAKIGGLFYLRPEIGYSFSSLPETVDYSVRYEDGSSETETYNLIEELGVPDIFFKGFTANIGIGFAF